MIDDGQPLPGMFWRLDENHTPVKCQSFAEYSASAEKDRHVAYTEIGDSIGVSTIFLCSPVGHGIVEHPHFFETMIFGGPLDHCQVRYRTWNEAVAGHERLCEEVRQLLALSPEELEAELLQRAREQSRVTRERLLALGVPEERADHVSRAVSEPPEPSDDDACPVG